jgi:hypothetical protein
MSEQAAPSAVPNEAAPQQNDAQQGQVEGQQAKPAGQNAEGEELFTIKVNGKERRMTRQELMDHASMSYAANEKFTEAKQVRQKVDRIINTAKSNPIEALMDPELGLSKDQIRDAFEAWYAKEFIEPEMMTEEQRKLKQYEEQLAKYREQEEKSRKQKEEEEFNKLTEQQRNYLQTQLIEAMDKSNLPKTPKIVQRIAFFMKQNIENGWDAPIDFIVRKVKEERQAEIKDDIQNASIEQLVDLFGEDAIKKLQKHAIEKLRQSRGQKVQSFTKTDNKDPFTDKQKRRLYIDDVEERLRKMRTGEFDNF